MTDYIERINNTSMEGDVFDGQFISKGEAIVFENVKFSADQWKTYSLTDIVPHDGYDYEVQFSCYAFTGTTSGNKVECRLFSGTTSSNDYPNDRQYAIVCRAITRTSSTQNPGGSCVLVIKSGDRKITFHNTDGNGTSGNVSLYVSGIRRLGTNLISQSTNYISNIRTEDNTLTIGGELLDGQWIKSDTALVTGLSLGTSASSGYSLANILPDDGYTYELLCNAFGRSGTATNNNITLRVGTSSTASDNITVGRQVTRATNYVVTGGQAAVLAKATDKLYVSNSGSSGTCTNIELSLAAYRRVGTNDSKELKNICISSDTLVPNAVIYGEPTIDGSDVSGFTDESYLVVPNMKYDNAEYVVCFTLPTATPTNVQAILHIEDFLTVEFDTNRDVCTYLFDSKTSLRIFANVSGKLWVKAIVQGDRKTLGYSRDGVNYTYSQEFISDSAMTTLSNYNLTLGNNSFTKANNYNFLGSIHLDECYIKSGGKYVWQGMDYKRRYPIGGYIADGQWVSKGYSVFSGVTLSSGTHSYTVTNYLPENDVQYEILCYSRTNTGGTSGNATTLLVQSSDQVYGNPKISNIVTRTSSSVVDAKSFTLVCTQKNGSIPLVVQQTSGSTTGSCAFGLIAYRRVGDNT